MIDFIADRYKLDFNFVAENYTSVDYAKLKCIQTRKIYLENKQSEQQLKKAK